MSDFELLDTPSEEHVITYWRGILGKPADQNPGTDPDGKRHDVSTKTVYLASNVRGAVTRRINDISRDKPIVIPINPVVVATPHVPGHTTQECDKAAREDEDSATIASLTIDDGEEHNILDKRFRVHTKPFDVEIPPNAIAKLTVGKVQAVADGYYVILKPLSPGPHKINFKAKVDKPYEEEPSPWEQDVTYHFTVR